MNRSLGTNFPQLSWERCVQQVQAMNLPEEIQAKFLGETRAGSFGSTDQGREKGQLAEQAA